MLSTRGTAKLVALAELLYVARALPQGHTGGISHTIPERADLVSNRARRGRHGGRPPALDREVYKHRCVDRRSGGVFRAR